MDVQCFTLSRISSVDNRGQNAYREPVVYVPAINYKTTQDQTETHSVDHRPISQTRFIMKTLNMHPEPNRRPAFCSIYLNQAFHLNTSRPHAACSLQYVYLCFLFGFFFTVISCGVCRMSTATLLNSSNFFIRDPRLLCKTAKNRRHRNI